MDKLIPLLVLHHLADVAFQPSWLIKNKHSYIYSVYEHSMIYAGCISAGLMWLGIFSWWMFFFILIGHLIVDTIKYQWLGGRYEWVYLDQAIHYAQLIVIIGVAR